MKNNELPRTRAWPTGELEVVRADLARDGISVVCRARRAVVEWAISEGFAVERDGEVLTIMTPEYAAHVRASRAELAEAAARADAERKRAQTAELVRVLYDGIMVRAGLVIDAEVAEERARNLAAIVKGPIP